MKRPMPFMKQIKAMECRILIVKSDSIKVDDAKCVQNIDTPLANQKPIPNLVNLFIIPSNPYHVLNHLDLV